MGGFFIDYWVVGITRMVRRESRRSQTIKWKIADGRFTKFTTTYGTPTLPLVDYMYEVKGQSFDGSATGMPIKDDRINRIGDAIDSFEVLHVRYDPVNPTRSRILNEDNPRLPFEVDLLSY